MCRFGWHIPGYIPNTGVDDDYIWLRLLTKIGKDAFHVVRKYPCDEIEPDQVMVRAILPNLSVLRAVVHMSQSSTLYQTILFKGQLSLMWGQVRIIKLLLLLLAFSHLANWEQCTLYIYAHTQSSLEYKKIELSSIESFTAAFYSLVKHERNMLWSSFNSSI